MEHRKLSNLILVMWVIVSLLLGSTGGAFAEVPVPGTTGATAARDVAPYNSLMAALAPYQERAQAPASPTDESQVPHYFGPNTNWALSPFTVPDVAVEIAGDGNGATAVASVGANGTVTGITLTSPGSGYTAALVNITGAGTGATAAASVAGSGSVTAITVDARGQRLYGADRVVQRRRRGRNPRAGRQPADRSRVRDGRPAGADAEAGLRHHPDCRSRPAPSPTS